MKWRKIRERNAHLTLIKIDVIMVSDDLLYTEVKIIMKLLRVLISDVEVLHHPSYQEHFSELCLMFWQGPLKVMNKHSSNKVNGICILSYVVFMFYLGISIIAKYEHLWIQWIQNYWTFK